MSDYVFQNARFKFKELTTLDKTDLEKLLVAEDEKELMQFLSEKKGKEFESFDQFRESEELETFQMLKENSDGKALKPLIILEDYKNLRASIKAKFSNIEVKEPIQDGLYLRENLRSFVNTLDRTKASSYMYDAVTAIEREKEKDSFKNSDIDVILDKYMYKEVLSLANKSLKKYFSKYINLINLNTMVRCKKLNLDAEAYKYYYLSQSDKDGDPEKIYAKTPEEAYSEIFFGMYDVPNVSGDIFNNEINLDIFAYKYWGNSKWDYETEKPIFYLYFKRRLILKIVNLIYSLKKFKESAVLKKEDIQEVIGYAFS